MCGFSSSHNVESGGREKCAGTVKAKPGEEETLEAFWKVNHYVAGERVDLALAGT